MNTMLPTINGWSYLVDWEKVSKHIKDIEICL
ncbi:MAG TPA: DpnII family type II restriction endonuclease, partial [Candidatus Cloacimonas sp.]|nr:DpnII family type II restriction endonuclease [Candidatus Cloacimonas sp.]